MFGYWIRPFISWPLLWPEPEGLRIELRVYVQSVCMVLNSCHIFRTVFVLALVFSGYI